MRQLLLMRPNTSCADRRQSDSRGKRASSFRVRRQRFVAFLLAVGLVVACDAGDVARPSAAMGAATSGGEGGTDSIAGGSCNSCSVDTDCQNSCGRPPFANYVWCCSSATCYTWANACPTTTMDAASASVDAGFP